MKYPPNAGRPLPGYEAFHKALMNASFHNAADGAGEGNSAMSATRAAAKIAVINGWRFWQIEQAHKAAAPLVDFGTLMNCIMTEMRSMT